MFQKIKKNPTLYIYVFLFIVAFSLRWYKLSDHLFFGFEQGRDALIAIKIAHFQNFVLVGPKTDLSGIFHGAYYYYFLAITYFFSKGNPLFTSLILVIINSLIPLVFYKLIIDQTKSKKIALLGSIISIFSLELITYSRWLSNVSPAPFFTLLSFLFLWKYHKFSKSKDWLMAIFWTTFASQFQIILSLEFTFVFLIFLTTKFIKIPSKKTLLKSVAIVFSLFAPMLLYNLRNKFSTITSIKEILTGRSEGVGFSLIGSLTGYSKMIARLIDNTFSFSENNFIVSLFLSLLIFGLLIKNKKKTKMIFFFLVWTFMSLPVIFFTHSLNLEQLYLGSALGLIGLTTISLRNLMKQRKTLFGGIILGLLIIAPMPGVFGKISQNKGMFFITVQDDLNYKDQKNILNYIKEDSQNQPYRLKSFTIPYYQEEAWQYLNKFYFPNHSDLGSKFIYITIEEKVEPYWEKEWIKDLGNTKLQEEKLFGKIRVQKREILSL